MIETIEKDGKKLFKYSWQPMLADGTPVGGIQVVEADTAEEIPDKIAKGSYNHLYLRNRELMREKELKPATPLEVTHPMKPRPLTASEKMQLARDFTDPEKIESALDVALESRFGAKPQAVTGRIEENASDAKAIRAAQEASAWREANPNFHASQQNCVDLAKWIEANAKGEFTYANFQKAFEALSPALETALPSVAEIPAKQPETQTPSRIAGADESATQPQPKIPSPVTRRQASGSGEAKREGLTVEQIRRMPTAEYRKRLLSDPEFVKQVNNLNFAQAR